MTLEEAILQKVRSLPIGEQQELLRFAEVLVQRTQETSQGEQMPLGQRLRGLRAKIVESGEGLLSMAEFEQEMAEQREVVKNWEVESGA